MAQVSSDQQYRLGYDHFYDSVAPLTSDQLKQAHPLFRRGYRTAQQDYNKRNNKAFPTTLYDIPRRPEVFVPDWNDIMAATRKPRYARLHLPHMQPVLALIVRSVENNKHKVTRYSDVVQMVSDAFEIVLQYGYDEGVLDARDLKQYNYDPK